MRIFFAGISVFIIVSSHAQQAIPYYQPVNFSRVKITDAFWKPKMQKVATVTIPACVYQTETVTPRIRNFEKLAKRKGEKHEGIYYDDSDVYKALEAIAYSLSTHPDKKLEQKADEWIDKIAAAQLPDGYLNTYYALGDIKKRWTDMEKHEDYCAGHLIEAGIAYYNATGKRKLLNVAIRFANHIDSTFRLSKRPWVSGHQEIELALMKLFHLFTNDPSVGKVDEGNRYLQLADWFLDQRGKGYGRGVIWDQWKDPAYCQDAVPVKEQKEITGHAVRAMYMYTGAADVASVTGDAGYMRAMKTVWEDVVYRNMYITGGIGSSGTNEGFSVDYDLPNENAYCETCASVGMVFWNQRMNQLTGESKYIDVLERSLYNGALDGLSLSGDRFFYGNPLASRGQHARREWFGTACCPSNIARLVSSVGNYVYGQSPGAAWINLFIQSNASLVVGGKKLELQTETEYPLKGNVSITLNPETNHNFKVYLRLPGWLRDEIVPGDLYTSKPVLDEPLFAILLNGEAVDFSYGKGYAVIEREWKKDDKLQLVMPMEVRQIHARPELKQNEHRMALQRGPLVYCVEGVDNGGQAWNIIASDSATWYRKPFRVGDEPVIALQAELPVVELSNDGAIQTGKRTVTAIPYYTWANRGRSEMQVWLPTRVTNIKLNY